MASIQVAVLATPLDLASAWTALGQVGRTSGASANFIGWVRDDPQGGEPLQALRLEHYPGMTEQAMRRLAETACERFQLDKVLMWHRCGDLRVGDPIVVVAAEAAHRRAALDAVDFLMDHLKSCVPFWKQETHGGGQRWVPAKSSDQEALARWSAP